METKISTKAITQRGLKISLLVLLMLAAILLTLAFLLLTNTFGRFAERRTVLFVFALSGILVFVIWAVTCSYLFAREYSFNFGATAITIASPKSERKVQLSELEQLIIHNRTDYSKIIIQTHNKTEKYYVGLTRMLKSKEIIDMQESKNLKAYFEAAGFTFAESDNDPRDVLTFSKNDGTYRT
ncbi:hypothetical protein [Culicoidibacter larvae]|uniref:Uncharacterized protein n=1 Tax=Culicoidibacter larvae TaxID=2579976 RepID=A0A5R8QE79_9FIRM|nr:hypothetical protein [Culicoidibacter larvae]TLG74303.1 hypothetical protein FEZ08_06240 [Culicoidibacter larvae]